MEAVINKDRDRAQRNAEANIRAASALPLQREKILENLYVYLPNRIMVMMEDQCKRMRRQTFIDSALNAIQLRGSDKALFGNPPRVRTVSYAADGLLTCSCGFFNRMLLPCGHLLWVYSQLGTEYPLTGIHKRWLRVFCEKPELMPARTATDKVAGPILPLVQWRALLASQALAEPELEPDQMQIVDPTPPAEKARRTRTQDDQRRLVISPLVEQIWALGTGTAIANNHLAVQLKALLAETAQLVKDRYHCEDPFTLRIGRTSDQRAGKRPGDGRRLPRGPEEDHN